jgi:saccharopine dehydrogenase (NAD+, L-lysine-forming)
MKVLVVGAGGVGAAFAAIAQRRPVFERVTLADVSSQRAHEAVARLGEADRFAAERVDATRASTSRSSAPACKRA